MPRAYLTLSLKLGARLFGLGSAAAILGDGGAANLGLYSLITKTLTWVTLCGMMGFEDFLLINLDKPRHYHRISKLVLVFSLPAASIAWTYYYFFAADIDSTKLAFIAFSVVATAQLNLFARKLKNNNQIDKAIFFVEFIPALTLLIASLSLDNVVDMLAVCALVRFALCLSIVGLAANFSGPWHLSLWLKHWLANRLMLTSFVLKLAANFRPVILLVIFGLFLSLEDMGRLGALTLVLGVMTMPMAVTNERLLPSMMRSQSKTQLRRNCRTIARKSTAITFSFAILSAVFYRLCIPWLPPNVKNLLHLDDILILGTASLICAAVGPVKYYYMAIGRERIAVTFTITCTICALVFSLCWLIMSVTPRFIPVLLLIIMAIEQVPLYVHFKNGIS